MDWMALVRPPANISAMPVRLPSLQQLEPIHARLCLEVGAFLKLHCQPRSSLVLAVSGGADSTALMVITAIMAKRLDLELAVMHVNHMLRPDAHMDAEFVEKLCRDAGLHYELAKIDIRAIAAAKGCGLEEAGRAARYEALEKFRRSLKADFILLAHHAGDLGEDVLMRLIRGSGWPALGGMKAREGHILRPLLEIMPSRLKNFLASAGFEWREDSSNASLDYRRNRIRHLLMPLLLAENPSFYMGIANLRRQADIDARYWHNFISRALAAHPWHREDHGQESRLILPSGLLSGMEPAARLRLYHAAITFLGQNSSSFTPPQARCRTLFQLERAYVAGSSGKCFQLPGRMVARIDKKNIIFSQQRNGREDTGHA